MLVNHDYICTRGNSFTGRTDEHKYIMPIIEEAIIKFNPFSLYIHCEGLWLINPFSVIVIILNKRPFNG
ncbi:MAG: hypothetical protein HC867_00015 [Bacteroidia bacterium]|nr:hypothetical protein [Bacteroidia bacterium]